MSADNKKLRDFISKHVSSDAARQYQTSMKQLDEGSASGNVDAKNGMVMKKETVSDAAGSVTKSFSSLWVVGGVAVLFVALLVVLRIKRRRDQA